MSESRFSLILRGFLNGLRELRTEYPHLFSDLNDDDARALGREAADRAVRRLLQEDK